MESFFRFRTAEFTDHCQTTLDQQAGLLHAATTWQGSVAIDRAIIQL